MDSFSTSSISSSLTRVPVVNNVFKYVTSHLPRSVLDVATPVPSVGEGALTTYQALLLERMSEACVDALTLLETSQEATPVAASPNTGVSASLMSVLQSLTPPSNTAQQGKPAVKTSFWCSVCNRPFVRRSTLRTHVISGVCVRNADRKVKVPTCSICKKSFTRYSDMQTHYTTVHDPDVRHEFERRELTNLATAVAKTVRDAGVKFPSEVSDGMTDDQTSSVTSSSLASSALLASMPLLATKTSPLASSSASRSTSPLTLPAAILSASEAFFSSSSIASYSLTPLSSSSSSSSSSSLSSSSSASTVKATLS